ncbi:MAG: GAF domain-containing protein [Nitrospirae bacterium]|nr:GAF domain-containing protein [Nitrospirota bacterium]MBI3595118.1 GAF domain-containing protein [Nitrospirota bacterium]
MTTQVRKTGLQNKLVLSILGVGLLSVFLVLTFVYIIGKRSLKESIGLNFKKLAEASGENLNTLINNHLEEATLIASSNSILSAVEESNQFYEGATDQEIQKRIEEIEQRWVHASGFDAYLMEVQNNKATFYLNTFINQENEKGVHSLLLVTNNRGALVAASKSPSHYSYSGEPWWQMTLAGGKGKTYISNIEWNAELGNQTLSIGTPILKNGKVIGVFYMVHDAHLLFHSLGLAKVGKTDHAVIVDSERKVLFDPLQPKPTQILLPELAREVLNGETGWISSRYDLFFGGRDSINGFSPVKLTYSSSGQESFAGTRWTVLTSQDPKETYAPIYTLLIWIGLIGLIGAALIGVFGLVISRGIVRPISTLIEGTELIGGGNLNHHIQITTGDEIEDLAKHFNDMTLKLKIFYFKLEEEVRSRTKELEYQKNEISALYSIVTVLNQSRELKEILENSLAKVVELMAASSGVIWMMDEKTSHYTIRASHQLVLNPIQLESLMKVLESVGSKVILEGTSWVSENVTVQEDITKIAYSDIGFFSVYAIPLSSKKRVVGVFFLLYKNIRGLSSNEITMLESFGNQMGVAIEHALLFSRLKSISPALPKE